MFVYNIIIIFFYLHCKYHSLWGSYIMGAQQNPSYWPLKSIRLISGHQFKSVVFSRLLSHFITSVLLVSLFPIIPSLIPYLIPHPIPHLIPHPSNLKWSLIKFPHISGRLTALRWFLKRFLPIGPTTGSKENIIKTLLSWLNR